MVGGSLHVLRKEGEENWYPECLDLAENIVYSPDKASKKEIKEEAFISNSYERLDDQHLYI